MGDEGGFIVVGVDQTPAARAALEFALGEGLAHGYAVEVVTAWLWSSPYDGMSRVTSIDEGRAVANALQDRVVRLVGAGSAALPIISQTVVHAHAGHALVDRAEGARMLVIGSARKGTLARAFLGSVSEYCVRNAPSPVVVVGDAAGVRHRHATQIQEVVT
jgi:nucleotide-binding universal stress UspA family protein